VLSAAARQRHLVPSSVSRDGAIACTESGGGSRGDIVVLRTAGGPPVAAIDTPYDETNGMLSPDGRLLAYQSDESGRWDIYLLQIADRRRTLVSPAGGTGALWAPDGGTLFYHASGRLMSVTVERVSGRIGAPVDLMPIEGLDVVGIGADGRILLRRRGEGASRDGVLTLEWVRELRRILGPPETALPR
jgi:dipeptidyl aminopeptidase/acylaminoacyl peptidase